MSHEWHRVTQVLTARGWRDTQELGRPGLAGPVGVTVGEWEIENSEIRHRLQKMARQKIQNFVEQQTEGFQFPPVVDRIVAEYQDLVDLLESIDGIRKY